MQQIQSDLRRGRLLENVEILGVNRLDASSPLAVKLATIGNPLPFLQDTAADRVWSLWGVTYRDVWILDASNRVVGVYNLTAHDLTVAENYAELEQMLAAVANGGDGDSDGLPDAWEDRFLKTLVQTAGDDPDHDGFANHAEFAFGTDPLNSLSSPALQTRWNDLDQFTVSFNRSAGTGFEYFVDTSTNLVRWTGGTASIRAGVTNLWDGTGRSKAVYTLTRSRFTAPIGFVRAEAEARPAPP